ncbi:hypothetical protein QCK34_002015 [Enterobacter asburiae]|nr:hypothetical protein [Enterobacter asburiae]
MPAYSNKGGDSGVVFYETNHDSIIVRFSDGMNYVYDSVKPGAAGVSKLKELASAGQGLNSYINTVIKTNYSRKYR